MLSVWELSLDEMRCTMLCWTSESDWKAGSVLSSSISALELLCRSRASGALHACTPAPWLSLELRPHELQRHRLPSVAGPAGSRLALPAARQAASGAVSERARAAPAPSAPVSAAAVVASMIPGR